MGACPSTRYFPPDRGSSYWKKCGHYNDWVYQQDFCCPLLTSSEGNDSTYCDDIGDYQGEWKLRTPADNQAESAWIVGGGNSVVGLQEAIQSINATSPLNAESITGSKESNGINRILKIWLVHFGAG